MSHIDWIFEVFFQIKNKLDLFFCGGNTVAFEVLDQVQFSFSKMELVLVFGQIQLVVAIIYKVYD